jgi:hypothetical protein
MIVLQLEPDKSILAAAPFIGLVYAMLRPFFGIATIAKLGYQAYRAPI